jgi:hypothetical protein
MVMTYTGLGYSTLRSNLLAFRTLEGKTVPQCPKKKKGKKKKEASTKTDVGGVRSAYDVATAVAVEGFDVPCVCADGT